MKPETVLTRRILMSLREMGGIWEKIHGGPFQVTALPDIIGCYEGYFFGLEVKLPGKERSLTRRQALILSRIKTRGKGVSGVITSPEEAMCIVRCAMGRGEKRRTGAHGSN